MIANTSMTKMKEMKVKLSTLWIVVLVNMIFADIFSFMNPGTLKEIMAGGAEGLQITPEFMLIAAVITEIPILMILLARVLKYPANRWANIIAGIITIVYVIGLGSATLSYIFIASVEVVCMALIVWLAWKWTNPES